MAEPLRPHAVLVDGMLFNIIALPAGGFAAATSNGVELFDALLAPCGTISGTGHHELRAVPGDRIAAFDRMSHLFLGAAGGELAVVDLATGLLASFVVTARGFIAVTSKGAIIDVDGARHTIELAGVGNKGVHYRDGAAIAGHDGLVIVGADGEVRARAENRFLSEDPTVVDDWIVVPERDELIVFDGDAHEVMSIPQPARTDSVVAFGTGLLARDPDAHVVTYWDLTGHEPVEVWTHKSIQMLASPVACGRFAVLPSYDGPTTIFDAESLIATLPFTGYVRGIAPLGDGIAFAIDDQPAVTWWRRSDVVHLPHDVAANGVIAAPGGIASFEGRAIYVWRPGAQGPEVPAPVACEYPIAVPLIIGHPRLTIAGAGRQLIRGVTPIGKTEAVSPGLSWRHPITRDEATASVDRLVKRGFAEVTGPADAFRDMPPAKLVDLHGRALFAPTSLSAELKLLADDTRGSWFDEIAAALATSPRVLRAALKARKPRLVPPRPVVGYDYLGTFTTSGALTVSDPCHLGKPSKVPGWSLSKKVAAADGLWHVFATNAPGKDAERTAELAVVHDSGFDVYASEQIATVGVDAGCVGIFDKACPKVDLEAGVDEGVIGGLGAITWSGYGDGMYPVFAGSLAGKVVKLRVSYISDTPEIDRLLAPVVANATAKPYSASAKFSLGDTLAHVKFGPGSVIRVGTDGKIDVRFADATRTLVHGKR